MIKDSENSFLQEDSVLKKNFVYGGKSITTISKKSGTSALLNKLTEKTLFCQMHEKNFEAFCFEDNKLLCVDCILLGHHKNHKIKSILESFEKLKKKINLKI